MIDEVRRNPQRWLRVQELFEAGLGLTPAARRHMLDQRCHDDEAVRSEVESLLDGADLTGDRIAQAVQQAADGLFRRGEPETGEDVGAYRIEKRLGSGGMGTVYLAHRADGEFQRTVAVKIIRTDLAGRADLLLRFKRERQILADLDHPNIARMLDGGVTQAGFPYFVMEYVRGEPILTYCAQHELSLDQRLALFSTLCAAVTYAHSQGIIHRDIKPGNVLVTLDGVPKLLDFGIAKLTVGAAGGSAAETATVERLMTPDYASPEILRGEPASEASDVYALGVLLYEMVAGRHPWRESGQSSRSLLQRISAGDALPPAQHPGRMSSPLPAGSGRDLNAIVMRAMKASPADRHPSVQALAEDVSRFRAVGLVPMNDRLGVLRVAQIASRRLTSAAAYVDNFVRLRPWDGWVATAATASVALLTLPFAVDHLREQQSPPTPVRFQIESSSDTRFANVSLSPDGRRLALVGMQTHGSDRLWLRALHSVEPKPVPGTDGIRGVPIWSPDSRFVAIGTPGKLKRIDVSGGPPQTMCDMPHALAGGAWASDGRIVFGAIGGGLSKADVAGNCSQLTALDSSREETMHGFPVLLPDNKHFLYVIRAAPEHSGIYIGSLEDKPDRQVRKLLTGGTWVAHVPARSGSLGHLMVVREGSLFLQPFDEARLQVAGEPRLIATGLAPVLAPAGVSARGVLVYQTAAGPRRLVWVDRQGNVIGTLGSAGLYNRIALSPGGTHLAVQVGDDSPAADIWLMDLERGTRERFTSEPHMDIDPLWSPDGARVIFASNRGGRVDVLQKLATGTANEEVLLGSDANKYPVDVSRDGQWLIYTQTGGSTADDLWVYPLRTGGKPSLFAGAPFAERLGVFSPDGRAVAYISDESGRFEVYLRHFPAWPDKGRRIVSTGGGTQPRWSPTGGELYFIAPDGTLMQAHVSHSPDLRVSTPRPMFQTHVWSAGGVTNGHRWDIAPDGRRFLINTAIEPVSQNFTVVLNWSPNLAN